MLIHGVDFLTEALKRLYPNCKKDEDTLVALVEDIYKEKWLYVNSREYIH